MSHQLSATHLVYRLTDKPSAAPLRKIGTLSATGLMPALLAACGGSAGSLSIGTPVTATSAFLITGTGTGVGAFGANVLGVDADGDGPNEVAIFGAGAVYVSKLPSTDLTTGNYHSVGEYEERGISGWTFNNVAAPTGTIGFAKIAAGDLNGDGFEDIVVGEPTRDVAYRQGFTYSDPNNTPTDITDDVVNGHTLGTGTGRVSVVFGGPNSIVGAGRLDFNVNFAGLPTSAYTTGVYTIGDYSNVAGSVLLGGRIGSIGSELAIGDVLDGTDFSGHELIVVSGGRAADTNATANPNEGLRISIINGSKIGGAARYLVETNEGFYGVTPADADVPVVANTVSAWTIYTGPFEDVDGDGVVVREVADSPLAVGDIGGNDTTDIIVARYVSGAGTGNAFTGQVHVVYGRSGSDVTPEGATDSSGDPIPAGATDVVLNQSGWEGTDNVNGFTVSGFPTGTDPIDRAFAGASVAAADINGDGKKDLIIGTPGNTQEFNTGQVYVIYGADSGLGNINVGTDGWHQNFTLGFEIKHSDPTGGDGLGVLGAGNLGASVTSVGDFNSDGIEDIAIGAPTFSPSQTLVRGGAAYIIFGRDTDWSVNQPAGNPASDTSALQTNFSGNILLDQSNWSNGGQYGFRIISSQADARMGLVSSLGDVNGDTITDVGISAILGGTNGAVFALYGADQNAFGNISVGVPTFPRTRDGVEVDANGNPIVTTPTTTVTAVVPGTGEATASAAPDAFFDVA